MEETPTAFIRRKTMLDHFMYWKLAILKASGKCIAAIIVALINSMNEKSWSEFTTTGKWCVFGGAVLAGWQVLEAFLSTTMSDLQEKKNEPTVPVTGSPSPAETKL